MSIRVSWSDAAGELVMGGQLVTPAQVAAAVADYNASGAAELDAADVEALLRAAGRAPQLDRARGAGHPIV